MEGNDYIVKTKIHDKCVDGESPASIQAKFYPLLFLEAFVGSIAFCVCFVFKKYIILLAPVSITQITVQQISRLNVLPAKKPRLCQQARAQQHRAIYSYLHI